jgi:hypothetical protein
MLVAKYAVQHSAYIGSTDTDGYPTGDEYGSPVARAAYDWYPLSSQLSPAGEYDRRVITSKVLMVPDPSAFSSRDRVVLPGEGDVKDRTYFVSEDMRDYTTGPFGYDPGGEVVLEKVTG